MLPSVSASDVHAAIDYIDCDGVPAGRGSTKFCLVVGSRHYPPKYVVALAARRALGRELRPDEFSGGAQTNVLLETLGFEVASCVCGGAQITPIRVPVRSGKAPVPTRPHLKPSRTGDAHDGATIVRIVSRGRTPQEPRAEERILLDALGRLWPEGLRTRFVLTPGGFVHGTLPSSWNGRSGWDSRKTDIDVLVVEAERQLARVVTERVFQAARGKTDVLTIGIDLTADNADERAELVAVFDIAKQEIAGWTGKSYPTPQEERVVIQVVDLDSHLMEIAGERALVLGCHDLNMYSPRGYANQSEDGVRRARCDEMRRKVARFRPTVVLQHPHSTDTPNIWRLPWLTLAREVPSVRVWASGIAHYNWNGRPRAKLDRVLEQTKSAAGQVRDIVIDARPYS